MEIDFITENWNNSINLDYVFYASRMFTVKKICKLEELKYSVKKTKITENTFCKCAVFSVILPYLKKNITLKNTDK